MSHRPSLAEITRIADNIDVPDWGSMTTERLIVYWEEFDNYGEPAPIDLILTLAMRGLYPTGKDGKQEPFYA